MALIITMAYACDCRSLITRTWKSDQGLSFINWMKDYKPVSIEEIHVAFNIALFPPLFFLSALFYTDILSTCLVLRAYRLFMEREKFNLKSPKGSVELYFTGIVALIMRQTNIFWVAVFLGGLEMIRTMKSYSPPVSGEIGVSRTWQEFAISRFHMYRQGNIHDLPLNESGILGMLYSSHSDLELRQTDDPRFYPLSTEYICGCCELSNTHRDSTMALYRSSHVICGIRVLEWWGGSW